MKLLRISAVDQTGINLYEVMYEPRILKCHFILRKKNLTQLLRKISFINYMKLLFHYS